MVDAPREHEVPVAVPVNKPVSLIPVGLKEAGLDSPTFRASATYFGDQIDAAEKWLEGLVRASSKLAQEAASLAPLLGSFTTHCRLAQQLSEAVVDHDYTLLALKQLEDGVTQDLWSRAVESIKRSQLTIADPVRQFLQTEVQPFKEARRSLENTQKSFDAIILRYASQTKTKESSSLREDAFQVHEARKAYLRSSMDFCVLGPQLRAALDQLLIKIVHDQQSSRHAPQAQTREIERISTWSREMAKGERYLRHQLLTARRQLEEEAEKATRPSRDLDIYSTSTVPYLGSRQPQSTQSSANLSEPSSKQGWLFLRTLTGKPTREKWIRRWFYVNATFGSLSYGVGGGVVESEKIGVLLTNARAASREERRFCFEVLTKDTTILLQAETQQELVEWLSVFEKAKQKAVQEPMADNNLASSGNPSSDPAFAVSPAISHELATQRPDGQMTTLTEDPNASLLSPEIENMDPATRSSFDVNALRKQASTQESEVARDHASRIFQKLDIHKKVSTLPQSSSPASSIQSGGIDSLIAACHQAMPIAQTQSAGEGIRARSVSQTSASFSSSLAPASLVNPPATTNLTKTAIRVGVDRGLDLGAVDERGGIPSSLMANNWGSAAYGHQARVERGEVNSTPQAAVTRPNRHASDLTDGGSDAVRTSEDFPASVKPPPSPKPSPARHHKSASVMSLPGIQESISGIEYPSFYPSPLRAHDAQFRMLFPNVPQTERVVMVFRASWIVGEGQILPGRVFVTPQELYFYSTHLGLVLVSGAALANVSEVTVEGLEVDILSLYLIDGNGREDTLTMKIFLDAAQLIKIRVEYLISACKSESNEDLNTLLHSLVQIQLDDYAVTVSKNGLSRQASGRSGPSNRSRLHLDGTLPTSDELSDIIDASEVVRFRLPNQPVTYVPNGVDRLPVVERVFSISAKAMLHTTFGDKSAICPILYQQRGALAIRQHPWTKNETDGHMSRLFEFEAGGEGRSELEGISIMDSQSLDVASNHLCYVITDTKVPVHLPRSTDYTLVTKTVISYETISSCKLSIYTKVEWSSVPWFSKRLIEARALEDMELEASSTTALVAEQVERLGPNPIMKKVIDIYGNIGQHSETAQVSSKQNCSPAQLALRKRTMTGLFVENARSLFQSCCTTVLVSLFGALKFIGKGINAHSILLAMLLASLSLSSFQASEYARSWWHDRSTAIFMSRMGIHPHQAMSRGIYLKDLHAGIGSANVSVVDIPNACSTTFREVLSRTQPDLASSAPNTFVSTSTQSTSRRLRRTRQRLSTYRHDILIALRLINNIERETIQAEYENWLMDEATMCNRISDMLGPAETPSMVKNTTAPANQGKSRDQLAEKLGAKDATRVQEWYGNYCESCRKERRRLGTLDN